MIRDSTVRHSFDVHKVKEGLEAIGALMKNKLNNINLYPYREMEKSRELIEELSHNDPSHTAMMEFSIFLFQFYSQDIGEYDSDTVLQITCNNALKALTILPTELSIIPHGNETMEMFTYKTDETLIDASMDELYKRYKANPVIKLTNGSYLVPVLIDLYQAVYNRPFHLMISDDAYTTTAGTNRGISAEKIVYSLLSKVFGESNTFRSVNLIKGKNSLSDIDVLCVCGNYALVVQVKSKQLTMTARTGDNEKFAKDFKLAFQDAYDQGLVCRRALLAKDTVFIRKDDNKEIKIGNLKDAFILCVSTDNIAAISFLTAANIRRKQSDHYPIAVSVFELEIFTHYLNKPELFLYYMRQRTSIDDRLHAVNEICALAHHLIHKIWASSQYSKMIIDQTCASFVDKDYYAFKNSIPLENADDAFNTRWHNKDFDAVCDAIRSFRHSNSTDILFTLLDYSSGSIDSMMDKFALCRNQTEQDHKIRAATFYSKEDKTSGISYIVSILEDYDEAFDRLQMLCSLNQYKYKADRWIGLGCCIQSGKPVDYAVIYEEQWSFDPEMESIVSQLDKGTAKGKKRGRNDQCPCGSNKKYIKCCGKGR